MVDFSPKLAELTGTTLVIDEGERQVSKTQCKDHDHASKTQQILLRMNWPEKGKYLLFHSTVGFIVT